MCCIEPEGFQGLTLISGAVEASLESATGAFEALLRARQDEGREVSGIAVCAGRFGCRAVQGACCCVDMGTIKAYKGASDWTLPVLPHTRHARGFGPWVLWQASEGPVNKLKCALHRRDEAVFLLVLMRDYYNMNYMFPSLAVMLPLV